MNKIINKFVLAGPKFMAELHLRQTEFTYSACGPFTKHRKRIQKFRETGGFKHLSWNQLNKACFADDDDDDAYTDSIDLAKGIISGKILKDRA